MGFLQFWLSKIKLLLASMKSLINCENPYSNQKAVCDLEVFPKPAMNVHGRNLTKESKGKPEQVRKEFKKYIYSHVHKVLF
jgi:hypothetical protein